MTVWAYLPNAAHIDRVLASVRANPEQWASPRADARNTERDSLIEQVRAAEWAKARQVVRAQMREPAWSLAWDAAREAGWYAATRYAIIALCAYDDCAYMLDSDPGELAIVAEFGNRNAILLLPACKAFHSLKELA